MCLQGSHLCCAAVQELLQARSWTAVRLKSLLLHLDDAILSCCAGGPTCISAVLAAAAWCLHTQSVACRACIQQLQGQPSTSGGYQHSSADEGGQESSLGGLRCTHPSFSVFVASLATCHTRFASFHDVYVCYLLFFPLRALFVLDPMCT